MNFKNNFFHLQRKWNLILISKIIVEMDNIYIQTSDSLSFTYLSCTGGVGKIIFTGRLAGTVALASISKLC